MTFRNLKRSWIMMRKTWRKWFYLPKRNFNLLITIDTKHLFRDRNWKHKDMLLKLTENKRLTHKMRRRNLYQFNKKINLKIFRLKLMTLLILRLLNTIRDTIDSGHILKIMFTETLCFLTPRRLLNFLIRENLLQTLKEVLSKSRVKLCTSLRSLSKF